MKFREIGMLKPKSLFHALAGIVLLMLLAVVSTAAAPSDLAPEAPAAKSSEARSDSVTPGKTDDSPEATRRSLRQKLIGLVADSALEIPAANLSSEPQTRAELVQALESARKANNLPAIIRGALELLTRFEPEDDFSIWLWRAAGSIEIWQRSTGSGNMSRLLDGILDLCALLPAENEANFRAALLRASLLTRRKDFAASDAILTGLRDRAGLPREIQVLVIVDLGDNAVGRRDYDAALSAWELLEDRTENALVVQPLLRAVFVNLERGKRQNAYRVLDVLREMDPGVIKSSPAASQVNELLALSRNHADSDGYWDASAKWWPDWLAVDQKLGAPDSQNEIVIPLIPNLTELGTAVGRAAAQDDPVERARGMRKLAHAARWEPSMLKELTVFAVSLNSLKLSAVIFEYRRFMISAYEQGNVKDPALRRAICCMAIIACIDSHLNEKAQAALRDFAALPAANDAFSQIAARLAALAALNTGKGLEEAIAAGEDALGSGVQDANRGMQVSLLAQLYERMGRQSEAISLLERELKHPSITNNEASSRLLKTRLETLQHRGERSSHLSAATRTWIEAIQLPWWDFARPRSLSEPNLGDIDQALAPAAGTLTACERIKFAALVDEDNSQPEKRQASASWVLGLYSCELAPDSETALRWARLFLDSDDLPGGIRESFLFGAASRAFTDDDADLFESLVKHPVRKTMNSREEEMVAQWESYFAASRAGDDHCVRLGESILRKPSTEVSRSVLYRIVTRLSAHGEFEKAKRLIGALAGVPSSMDPDNSNAATQLALMKVVSHDQKWRPLNNVIREVVMARFGNDSPPPAPTVPASDERLLSLNLPAEEATQVRLQAIRAGRFTAQSSRFWEHFMKDLPRTAENLLLRSAILRAAIEGAQGAGDDATLAETVRMVRATLDIDSPEERRVAAELLAPLRASNNLVDTGDAVRLVDFSTALRTGAPMDVLAAIRGLKDDRSKRAAHLAALGSALAAGDQSLLRSLVETLSPQELLSDHTIAYAIQAYRVLGMKEEAALAERSARDAVYRQLIEFWIHDSYSSALRAFRLANLLGDQSLIPRSTAERLIDSQRHEWTKLEFAGAEALYRRDWDNEVAISEEALRKFPTYYHFLFLQGRALAALDRKDEALRSLQSYVSIVHDESEVGEARALIDQLLKADRKDDGEKK